MQLLHSKCSIFLWHMYYKIMLIPYTFYILTSLFFIFMANYPFEKCSCVHILGGWSEKVYVLHTHLNVGNYGWHLRNKVFRRNLLSIEFWHLVLHTYISTYSFRKSVTFPSTPASQMSQITKHESFWIFIILCIYELDCSCQSIFFKLPLY